MFKMLREDIIVAPILGSFWAVRLLLDLGRAWEVSFSPDAESVATCSHDWGGWGVG